MDFPQECDLLEYTKISAREKCISKQYKINIIPFIKDMFKQTGNYSIISCL